MPAHHLLEEILNKYIVAAGLQIGQPLFQSVVVSTRSTIYLQSTTCKISFPDPIPIRYLLVSD